MFSQKYSSRIGEYTRAQPCRKHQKYDESCTKKEKESPDLYRAPGIDLTPLNIGSIAESYQKIFEISADEAFRMASLTKGYSFAYQSLGYVYWEERNEKKLEEMMPEFDHLLAYGAYQKIWEKLSQNDKKASAGMDSNAFSTNMRLEPVF